jgi:NTP pyrophosphatase (non-canonical NTP hydrolase)
LQAANPELVLRSGLIEETVEVLEADVTDRAELQKEVGDTLWYQSEVGRFRRTRLSGLIAANGAPSTLNDYQAAAAFQPTLPIYTHDLRPLHTNASPQTVLAIGTLRVVDVLSPKTETLWHGYPRRPDLGTTLQSALVNLCLLATHYDISLEEAARQALEKVYNRPRKPHVVSAAAKLTGSGRERLLQSPWMPRLLGGMAMTD